MMHFNRDDVIAAARGRWGDILPALCRIDANQLTPGHKPCPQCGGKDRFRVFDDFDETGGMNCGQCYSKQNGDGLAAIMWLNGIDFPAALELVGAYLNVTRPMSNRPSAQQPKPPPAEPPPKPLKPTSELRKQFTAFGTSTPAAVKRVEQGFEQFCTSKPPITVDALHAVDAELVTWPISNDHGRPCIAVAAYRDRDSVSGYILRRIDGTEFPAFGKMGDRKTHMIGGSADGWIIPGGFDRLARATHVWRVEGLPDALAMFPLMPDDHAVVTNICGCLSIPPNIDCFAGKIVYSIGDADRPGQAGACLFAAKMLGTASEVKNLKLPYMVEKTHGKDIRDFCSDGATFERFMEIADDASPFINRVLVTGGDDAISDRYREFGFIVEPMQINPQRLKDFAEVIFCHSTNDPAHFKTIHDALFKLNPAIRFRDCNNNGFAEWLEKCDALEHQDIEKQIRTMMEAAPEIVPVPPEPVLKILWAEDLIAKYPQMREVVIEGIARRGETINIIAAPKVGKSWLAMSLALAIAFGLRWLGKFYTKPGKVLVVDNELHEETSSCRLQHIAHMMGLSFQDAKQRLAIINVRGKMIDLKSLSTQLLGDERFKEFTCIILDAWYRFQPEGSDENSNSDITQLYNLLDATASKLDCVFIAIHHTSKGNQAGKATTDVGAGAGSQSRAADGHLTIRQHTEENAVVVDAAVRSFPQPEPFCLRWSYPLWSLADDLDPKDIKTEKPKSRSDKSAEPRQSKEDIEREVYESRREKLSVALTFFPDGETESVIATRAGISNRVAGPIFTDLQKANIIEPCKVTKNKVPYNAVRLILTRPDRSDRSDKTGVVSECPTEAGGVGRTAALSLESGVVSDLQPAKPLRQKTFAPSSESEPPSAEELNDLFGEVK